MPILLAGEDAASDCFAGVGADVGLLAGGDCARRGVARHNVATDLLKEQESVKYELSLRRQELAGMEATSKRPGVVGVSSEWLRRHNDLKEKIVKLQVRLHEIEYELSKKPGD
jgi:hypothetical protein